MKDRICVVTGKRELEKALWEKKTAVLLALEGLDPLGSDLGLLRIFYDSGRPGREPYLEPEERLCHRLLQGPENSGRSPGALRSWAGRRFRKWRSWGCGWT